MFARNALAALAVVVILGGCTVAPDGTIVPDKAFWQGELPTGYGGRATAAPVLAQAATTPLLTATDETVTIPPRPPSPAPLPAVSVAPPSVDFPDVTVYPVDGDMEPFRNEPVDIVMNAEDVFTGRAGRHAGKSSLGLGLSAGEVRLRAFFDNGAAVLKPAAKQKIRAFAKTAKRTGEKISVIGYASARGNAAANTELARKRARVVAAELRKHGVVPRRISSDSAAPPPLMPEPGLPVGEAAARRADVRGQDRGDLFP